MQHDLVHIVIPYTHLDSLSPKYRAPKKKKKFSFEIATVNKMCILKTNKK